MAATTSSRHHQRRWNPQQPNYYYYSHHRIILFVMNLLFQSPVIICFFLVVLQFRNATNIQVFNNHHSHHHRHHNEEDPSHLPPPSNHDHTEIESSIISTLRNHPKDTTKFDNETTAAATTHPPMKTTTHHHHHLLKNKNETFGACLMVKDDNDLLYEWLAYHYTVLPLRYVLVASDIGSTQNPIDVLRRWKEVDTGLHYWSIQASDFTNQTTTSAAVSTVGPEEEGSNIIISSNTTPSLTTTPRDHHHAFLGRQRDFIKYCVQFMKKEGLKWISLIDTDEYVVINKIGDNENLTTTIQPEQRNDHHSSDKSINNAVVVDPIYYKLRNHPSLYDNNNNQKTILQIINDVQSIHDLSPCYTMPRVLHGALTNYTCSNDDDDNNIVNNLATHQLRIDKNQFNTLQFHQHALKGDFATSKFGKVFLDVSNLSYDTIEKKIPKNPHRPYKPECRPGFVYFPESLFYINHYLGSWERYSSRKTDFRRSKKEWSQRAYITTSTSCDKNVTSWLPKFVTIVGLNNARFLLGGDV